MPPADRTADDTAEEAESPELLQRLIAEYLGACDAGVPPDRAVFVAAHPDAAEGLREFFAGQDAIAPFATAIRPARRTDAP